ncbi:MAG: phytanoyl-CoA dioxygenase family protein [Gammaproteobacteria bacterium]|nr:phytanoyl-CoA dioxygenase family protein [Gammaproteobacteria bacterium]
MTQDCLPVPTDSIDQARNDMDGYGYCLLENALSYNEISAIRTRLLEQVAAEEQRDVSLRLPDGKQLVRFLINKGKVFLGPILHEGLHAILRHVLGDSYLLSSYHAHLAHPGGTTNYHTDQFWMPPPTSDQRKTFVKPGSITRTHNRGHTTIPEELKRNRSIAPAVVCNAMWMIDDFTRENGATLVVPGSHLSGREPDNDYDADANWVPAEGLAGTVCIFEGRTWHSTGANVTQAARIGLTTNFCAPQFRQQDNFPFGTRPEVLADAPDRLLELLGFIPWQGYGGYEGVTRVTPGQYALGEMKPNEAKQS